MARIVPAYLVTWAAGVVGTQLDPKGAGSLIDTIPGWFLVQAWFPNERIFFAGTSVAWSVSCEAFFYVLFPFIAYRLARATQRTVLTTGALAALVTLLLAVIWGVFSLPGYWITIFPPARLPKFILGMAIAVAIQRGWRSPIPPSAAIAICLVFYFGSNFLPTSATPETFMFAAWAVLVSSCASAELERSRFAVLHSEVLWRLGVWSYSFFLIHPFAIRIVETAHPGGSLAVNIPIELVLAVLFAYLLWKIVEKPAEKKLRPNQLPSAFVEKPA